MRLSLITAIVLNLIINFFARPHVPLIRFRGGANAAAAPAAQSTAAQPVAPALTKQASQGVYLHVYKKVIYAFHAHGRIKR